MEIIEDLLKGVQQLGENESRPIEKILENLFKDDEEHLQRSTDLDDSDLIWASQFEMMDKLVVEQFIYNLRDKKICKDMKNSIYRIRISRKRLGRIESFGVAQSQIHLHRMDEQQEKREQQQL